MKTAAKNPSYLVRNPYSYCFRMVVPKDLQTLLGKRELRYTLRTGFLGVAKKKSQYVAGRVHHVFRILRRGAMAAHKLTVDQIQTLVDQYIKESIESWDRGFYDDYTDDELPVPFTTTKELHDYVEFLDDIRDDLILNLNLGTYDMLEESIGKLLIKNEINNYDTNDGAYRKLCAEIHRAQIQLLPLQKRHMLCDFSYKQELPSVFPELYPRRVENVPDTDVQNSMTIERIIDRYWEEKSPDWKDRTATQYKTCKKKLLEFIGHDRQIHTINYQTGRDYKELLSKTPTPKGNLMAPSRANLYLGFASQVFEWAIKQHYTDVNPFSGLQYGKKKLKRADKQRDAFTTDDLKKIFVTSKQFGQDEWGKCKHPHFFWIPILGLYTGARIEEIGQLYVDDVEKKKEFGC